MCAAIWECARTFYAGGCMDSLVGGWIKVGNACTAWRGECAVESGTVMLACWALGRMELVCDKHLKYSLEGGFIFGYKST
ncbi:hypothetical protein L211DRAFT_842933 [Terfezia boudieri ATCC MYA-4762]|uniref:Uncharacterized protein n=1 Tax=Terfezia boudieri ATCC MYA-4762 TaxID=1051890 RepID=A0A3N4L931_9PEZI|nr:hypothetical protein L211DRAFT_842933 [Terfezia boudieri ATCC MYA-4762]